jgi:hypothetical protein
VSLVLALNFKEFVMKKYILGMILLVVMGATSVSAGDKGTIQVAPGLLGTGVRADVVVGEKSTWGGFYTPKEFETQGLELTGFKAGISRTVYTDELFKGKYSRYGIRYSSYDITDGELGASETVIITPFINVGRSFTIDSVVFNYGFGVGYSISEVSAPAGGTVVDSADYSGFSFAGDLNFGIKF